MPRGYSLLGDNNEGLCLKYAKVRLIYSQHNIKHAGLCTLAGRLLLKTSIRDKVVGPTEIRH